MTVEYWSREEIKAYCENPNLLIARANQQRARMIRETLAQLKSVIMSIFKQH